MNPRQSFSRFVLRGALAISLGLFSSSPGWAQEDPRKAEEDPRKAQAETLLQEGLKLHDKHRDAEALEKFKKAYATYPSPNTLVNIGRAEQLLGHPLDALRHYRAALRSPLLNPKILELTKKLVAELEVRFAQVAVTGPSGTKISIYGEILQLPLVEPLDVEPGTFILHANHDGKPLEGTVVAQTGRVVTLQLKAADESPPATSGATLISSPPEGAPPSDEGRFWGVRSITGLALMGAGLAAIGVGIGFKVDQSNQAEEADRLAAQLPPGACEGASALPSCSKYHDALEARNRDSNVATGLLVIGGISAGVGFALVAWAFALPDKRSSSTARIIPMTGLHNAGLMFSSSF